jgi:hypothetical protein
VLADLLTTPSAWKNEGQKEGDEKTRIIRRRIIKEGFTEVLLELFKTNSYDPKALFNNKSIRWFKNLFTPEEIKGIKRSVQQVLNNANLTIERLPD